MATSIFADILNWSQQRPAWQRDALRRLFTSGNLTLDDLDDLTEICKAQHGLAAESMPWQRNKQYCLALV